MFFLIGVILFIIFVIGIYFFVKHKLNCISNKYLGGYNLKEIIESARLEDQEEAKSLANMESVCLDVIMKDFPDININELKRKCETTIIDTYMAIENKDTSKLTNDKIKSFVNSRIDDLGSKKISYDNLTINKTVISKYEKNSGIATMKIDTSFWYYEKIDGNDSKKVQDRVRCELIYVIDATKVKDVKAIGINCPNCGSPITSLGHKKCSYCGSAIVDIVKKVWIINDLIQY